MGKSKATFYIPVLYYGSNKKRSQTPSVLGTAYFGSVKQMKKFTATMEGYIKVYTNTWPPKKRNNEKKRAG